jgi:hypothetical protein
MLSPGLEKCPRCGKRLHRKTGTDEYSAKDIAYLSLYIIGIAMIPIAIIVVVSFICVFFLK